MKPFLTLLFAHLGAHLLSGQDVDQEPRSWLHVDGYSHHFAAPGANAALLGLGITRYEPRRGRVI